MMELTKPSRSAAAGRNKDSLNGDGDDEEEAPGGIANMRVVNASKVKGLPRGCYYIPLRSFPRNPPIKNERKTWHRVVVQETCGTALQHIRAVFRCHVGGLFIFHPRSSTI